MKTLRKKLGLNQKDFGKRLGISQARVSQFEAGAELSERDKLALTALESQHKDAA